MCPPPLTPRLGCNGPGGADPLVPVVLVGPASLEACQGHPLIGGYPGLPDTDIEEVPLIQDDDLVAPYHDRSSLPSNALRKPLHYLVEAPR